MKWDEEVDLLVCGSGAAGLTAALVGAHEGLSVMLCEKSSLIGGTTATSGGTLWIPGAPPIVRAGRAEPVENVRHYLHGELGARLRSDYLEAFLAAGPAAIAYLEQHTDVKFQHAQNPDYHADAPGGSAYGRNIAVLPFDGRQLGKDFALLRPPRPVFMVLGGMMVGRREIPMLLRPFASWTAFRQTTSSIAKHVWSRLRYPRGTRLLIGNALVARFLFSLGKTKVKLAVDSPLIRLVREDDRPDAAVIGAIVGGKDGQRAVRARRAVVLATGGIAHDRGLRSELMNGFPHEYSMTYEGNTGDGMKAARAVGAHTDDQVESPAFWSPASVMKNRDGSETLWIHGHMDRGKPGLIAVNKSGKRFVNEADSYHDFVMAMFNANREAPTIPAWLICDHRFIRRYGLGLIRPVVGRLSRYIAAGYLHRADTLDALARSIGIDPAGFALTIEQHNRDAKTGVDTAFGRGNAVLNQFNGDPECAPNPCMAPMESGPYYAVTIYPCSIGTTVGLFTDCDARVLDRAGQAINGLYACGNDMGSVMRGMYPGPGVTLGPAVTFAYRAVMNIVGKPPS
ncbi:MAG: FAD-binding protein [Pseudomonadota bacterium]